MTNQIHADTDKQQYLQSAYLAGGCYWGLEDLIRKIPGVLDTKVGFSGGHIKNVSYKDVTKGDTGHAESIEIKFDSKELSYENLLFNFLKCIILQPLISKATIEELNIGLQYFTLMSNRKIPRSK